MQLETLTADRIVEEAKHELLEEWYANPRRFCKELFPDIFDAEFCPAVHDTLFDVIFNSKRQRRLVLAPRGIGKTSFLRAYCMRSILYGDIKFLVYISATETMAEMQTENIKRDLLANPLVKKIFGNVKSGSYNYDVSEAAEVDDSFSKKSWVAFGNTIILPRGCDQQIRGLNWDNNRPDLIALDDPEKQKELYNEENRKKTKQWFLGDVMQSVNRMRGKWEVIYIDTLKHHDALPLHLKDMNWQFEKLSICDENLKSKAPQLISDEELEELYNEFLADGELDVFYREYMNEPIAPETASFRSDYFRYYDETDGLLYDHTRMRLGGRAIFDDGSIESIVLVDPASTVTPQSDYSVVATVGIDLKNNRYYIRDLFVERVFPDQLYDEIIRQCRTAKARVIGLEVTSLNEFITFPLFNELSKQHVNEVEVIKLKPRQKKEDRIKALIPLYRRGYIYHNKAVCRILETQLLTFPNSKFDDAMDAIAYLAEMLSEGGRYFMPEDIDPIGFVDDDEYSDIYDEAALEINYGLTG